jgi:hypothetical protein
MTSAAWWREQRNEFHPCAYSAMKFLMYTVLVIVAVVAVVVVAGLLWFGTIWIAYQIKLGWREVPVHYRLSFSVEVRGVSYEGSTVAQITYRQIPYWQTLTEPGFASLYEGQAGCVKLPGEKMICLMPGAKTMASGQTFHSVGGIANQLLSVEGSPTGPKEKWRLIGAPNAETVAGSSDIPIDLLPPMIVLDDAAHPSSAHLFDPQRPEKTLGAGSRFVVAQIAVTNDPVSHDIETVLPWLADPGVPQMLSEPGDPFVKKIGDILSIKHTSIENVQAMGFAQGSPHPAGRRLRTCALSLIC